MLKSGEEPVHKECVIMLRVEFLNRGGNSHIVEKKACNGSLFDFV